MNLLSEAWLPAVVAGIAIYGVAWLVWRCFLSSTHPYEMQAEKRAKLLLSEFLTDEEGDQLSESGHLLVRSPSRADRIYRIPAGGQWIDVYDSGRLSARIAAALPEGTHAGNAVLMHKFMIEERENEFLGSASVQWHRSVEGDGSRWCHVESCGSKSPGRAQATSGCAVETTRAASGRSATMVARLEGGVPASGGVYWSVKDGEFVSVPKEGGVLEGGDGRTYIKVPLPIVLIVGPVMGLAFAFFLPLSGVLVLGSLLKNKLQRAFSAGKVGAAGMASLQMQPGASYLQPTGSAGAEGAPQGEPEGDGKIMELAQEIAEKRWREQ